MKVLNKEAVFHIGTLDIKSKSGQSYEGAGLSVSEHPNEWKRIARLDGEIHTLTKTSGKGVFIDYYNLPKYHKEVIIRWGLHHKYIEEIQVYQVKYYDSEYERNMLMEFENEAEARAEAEAMGGKFKKGDMGYKATEKLLKESMQTRIGLPYTLEQLTILYFDKTQPSIDGIWWTEILDASRLSAPRGVIFNRKLNTWRVVDIEGYVLYEQSTYLSKLIEKDRAKNTRRMERMLEASFYNPTLRSAQVVYGVYCLKVTDKLTYFITLNRITKIENGLKKDIDTRRWTKTKIRKKLEKLQIPEAEVLLLAQKLR